MSALTITPWHNFTPYKTLNARRLTTSRGLYAQDLAWNALPKLESLKNGVELVEF